MTDINKVIQYQSLKLLSNPTVTALILHSQFLTALAMSHLLYISLGISIIDTSRLREAVERSSTLTNPPLSLLRLLLASQAEEMTVVILCLQ